MQTEIVPDISCPHASEAVSTVADRFGFRLRHVGVAVPHLAPAAEMLDTLFGYKIVAGPFEDSIQKVVVSFLRQAFENAAEIELVAPSSEDAPVSSILARKTGAAYHLCFETTDIEGALAYLSGQGCVILSGPSPAVAFRGRRIAWVYAPTRQLFELLEAETVPQSGPDGPSELP